MLERRGGRFFHPLSLTLSENRFRLVLWLRSTMVRKE